MSRRNLVHMANQIGKFFASRDPATAAESIADHLRSFWDPSMRAEIIACLDEGGEGLDPAVREAVASLRPAAPGPSPAGVSHV